ncbi:MAG: hypothetical protein R3B48_03530 [Kofleriaceae bacterium]
MPKIREESGTFSRIKEAAVAAGRRTKRKLSSRPKHKRARSLKDRRMKARKAAAHKRGLARNKAKRRRRTGK